MPVYKQQIIYRQDLRNNPNALFLFGDNEARKGYGAQAREMRGEPNAVGIRTKRHPTSLRSSFWSDQFELENREMLDHDFARAYAHNKAGGLVVVPADGLGTGLAELDVRAPKTFAYLNTLLLGLEKSSESGSG